MMIEMAPTHASQLMRPRVSMLEKMKPIMAAITTKTAVQREWVDKALKAIEILRMADPATKIRTRCTGLELRADQTTTALLTKTEGRAKDLVPNATKQHSADVVNSVDMGVAQLEDADHPVRPGGDGRNEQQNDDARN